MALIKDKTKNGFTSRYWRILQLSSNFDRQDAVITLGLYKDKATRDADPSAVIDQFQVDLGPDFSTVLYEGVADTVKNIKLKKAYQVFMEEAEAELEKPEEEQDENLAFFADAVSDE